MFFCFVGDGNSNENKKKKTKKKNDSSEQVCGLITRVEGTTTYYQYADDSYCSSCGSYTEPNKIKCVVGVDVNDCAVKFLFVCVNYACVSYVCVCLCVCVYIVTNQKYNTTIC